MVMVAVVVEVGAAAIVGFGSYGRGHYLDQDVDVDLDSSPALCPCISLGQLGAVAGTSTRSHPCPTRPGADSRSSC